MKGCEALLLLLLCLSGTEAQGHNGLVSESSDEPGDLLQPDLWGELKELRDMVVEMRVELRNARADVQLLKDKTAGVERENAGRINMVHN